MPGLSRPIVVDTDALPRDEAAELERMLRAAGDAATALGTAAPSPDQLCWRITADLDGHAHTWRVPDPPPDPRWQPVLDYARRKWREAVRE